MLINTPSFWQWSWNNQQSQQQITQMQQQMANQNQLKQGLQNTHVSNYVDYSLPINPSGNIIQTMSCPTLKLI